MKYVVCKGVTMTPAPHDPAPVYAEGMVLEERDLAHIGLERALAKGLVAAVATAPPAPAPAPNGKGEREKKEAKAP